LQQRSFETREGEKRTVIEMQVDEVGPSLRYATAKVNRTQRGSTASGTGDDPWSGNNAAGFTDEPPF
ncbi:MAG: single-stranded DNA-binding protein, partial [Jatrophihabitantaceae bacterium]